jgi:glycosyltransferase involved in cell wall biosynthesis
MSENYKFNYRLGTIAQTLHWRTASGEIVAYEPYIREMRVWASLFKHVDIFAPLSTDEIRVTVSEYGFSNIDFDFVSYSHRISPWSSLQRLLQLPWVLLKLFKFIWKHDVLLIRSPSHFGLFAHIFVFLLRKKSITKYAGFFSWFEGERMPSIVERNIIEKVLDPPHYVLVYGPAKQKHLISFIPAAISQAEIEQLKSLRSPQGKVKEKLRLFTLGKLMTVKGYDLPIHALGQLHYELPHLEWELHLIGDGVELNNLQKLCIDLKIEDRVIFEGKLGYMDSMKKLTTADIVLMPGTKEGWPKVIIEGWAVGAVPVVVEAGISGHIIQHAVNGFLFQPNPESLKDTMVEIFKDIGKLDEIRKRGWLEVEEFSLECFSNRVEEVCRQKLKL